ncbi:c-type cytochrome [Pelomonas sp. CA6]|uniref:c-type cytochrome n=1 Tax=Pelomonas sp. CA6 TaxID=2907999 RepID=UPI001F4A4378|nr:c-type cytochrome [Pelomonas sp. CA6]MCH7342278.1 c-type cytochrome [Pelomonas sp. CA6]
MSSFRENTRGRPRALRALLAALALAAALPAALAQERFPGIGRAATPKEIAAWDIDVRPDFKGLPKGSGSVAKGQEVWEGKCAQCHGIFGESGEVFSPLVGGTTAEDVKTGRVARLNDPGFPGRTTLMKVATVSTLWDYINRAMPWTAPKSLSTEEVYAVTAYLLNMGGILPDDYVLSDRNIAEAQQRLPNRNGMTTAHTMWPGKGLTTAKAPDTANKPCMSNCAAEPRVASYLPDHARNAHGNLADQNRLVGPQRGAQTAASAGAKAAAAPAKPEAPAAPTALLKKNSCTACHAQNSKLVGPSFQEIAQRHGGRADAAGYLAEKIRSGGVGVWGQIPMPPQTLSADEARSIADWLSKLSR